MTDVEVMDLTKICRSFPESPDCAVSRDHFLDAIDKIFEGDTDILVVEGPEAIGKTTLLAQLARRHPHDTFCLFIKPTSRLAYTPEYLRLVLSEQLYWALYGELLPQEDADESFLLTHLPRLQRRAQRNRKPYYFIVDGLAELPKEEYQIQEIILRDVLPLGLSGFKFIFSGDLQQLSALFHSSLRSKSFPLAGFSLDETDKYLKPLNLDHQSTIELHKMCTGVPGHLAIIKRMLLSGNTLRSILDEDVNNLPDFISMEWRRIENASEFQKQILALLSFSRQVLTIDTVARLANLSTREVEEFCRSSGIIGIDVVSHELEFVSEAHRRFASARLQQYKQFVNDVIIDDLLKDAQGTTAVSWLPTYYEQAGRLDELLDYLTPDHFLKLIEHTQSLLPVYRRTDVGLSTAEQLALDGPLTRFCIQKSVIQELSQAAVWKPEIEARIAVKDYDAGLALARNTILKEDRLHLLALIARVKRQQGTEPEPELLEQIRLLYNQVDSASLGERAVEIAADLLYSYPDLAIHLLESSPSSAEDGDRLDWAFARLTIAALYGKEQRSEFSDAAEKAKKRIRNPNIQQFSTAAALVFGEHSAAEVMKQISTLEPKNRLFFLRQWAVANAERTDALEVVDYALDIFIKSADYTPKTRDLVDIAMPLASADNDHNCKRLVGRFDSQKGTIENLGTSEDYVRLQLLLAQAEAKYDFAAAQNRVLEVYWFISNLDDLCVKSDCLAWFVTSLGEIDPSEALEKTEGIHSVAQSELRQTIDKLLGVTAEHFEAARGAIRALAKAKPAQALDIIDSVNTRKRRDQARLEFLDAYIGMPLHRIQLEFVQRALDGIEGSEHKDEAVVSTLKQLASKKADDIERYGRQFIPTINYFDKVGDAHERCRAACFAYVYLSKCEGEYSARKDYLSKEIERTWRAIDVGWLRIRVAFRIARLMAEVSVEQALVYLDKAEQLKSEIGMEAEAPARTYIAALQLAIRAYAGLLPKRVNSEEHFERFGSLLSRIPSSGEQAGLWADLALYHHINGPTDICQRIVRERVKPLIETISDTDKTYKEAVIVSCAAALFHAHRVTALETIKQLPVNARDEALFNVCKFILSKQLPDEPYDRANQDNYAPSYDELVDICELIKIMSGDSYIYLWIEMLSDVLSSRRNRERYTRQQRADIAHRLKGVADTKLPDASNIRHQGFKIAADARIERIAQTGQSWSTLSDLARSIPNSADKAYVLAIIASSMPRREEAQRRCRFSEAVAIIDTIPSALDASARYVELADMIRLLDIEQSKQCLRRAMDITTRSNDPELIYPNQRRIIDLAHRIEPTFAASLASLADDDPARSTMRANLQKRLRILNLKREMLEGEGGGALSKEQRSNYSKAAWMNLAALNSGRLDTMHFDECRKYLKVASELPLTEAYPILAWTIENSVKRLKKTNQVVSHLLPIFNATILGAELAGRVATKSLDHSRMVKTYAARPDAVYNGILIHPGERDKAVDFIRDWFAKNARNYIKICDPYFGIHDLDILLVLRSVNPAIQVFVLTSKKQQLNDAIASPWDETYRLHWRLNVADHEPPVTEVVIVGTESTGELPIHDRWWLSEGGGICMGTSYNSLGITKTSELRILSQEESELREAEVDRYLHREKREHNYERLQYSLFTL